MKRFSAVPVAFLAVLTLLPNGAFADDKKNDPDEIGNRDVGKGVNFWSLEKEIALGKQLAQEAEDARLAFWDSTSALGWVFSILANNWPLWTWSPSRTSSSVMSPMALAPMLM